MVLIGFHAVLSRLNTCPSSISEILISESRVDKRVNKVLETAKKNNVLVKKSSKNELEKICKNKKNNGCIAIASELEKPNNLEGFFTLFSKQGLEYPPLVILDGITDPRNLGAIFRNVDATGFGGIIAPMDNSAPINDLVVRTSCGATDTVFYVRVKNLSRTIYQLQDLGYFVYGLASEAQNSLFSTNFAFPVAIVLGGEGKGLRKLTKDVCDELICVPMFGELESLNVSVASGVALFEVINQKMSIKRKTD